MMSGLFWLTDEQMARLQPCFRKGRGRPIGLFRTAGQVSDYTGAAALLDGMAKADWLLGDRGYDVDWLRDLLEEKGITSCTPGRNSRKQTRQIRTAPIKNPWPD